MSKNFIQNALLRSAGLKAYQMRARLLGIGRQGPRVFINSLPKSGTHLLTSELAKLPQLQNSYVHVKTTAVGDDTADGAYVINEATFRRAVRSVAKGQYFSGHLPFDPTILRILDEEDVVVINLIRDPRDMLVSLAHYVTKLRRHRLHEYFSRHCGDLNSQLETLICGPDKALDPKPRFLPYATVLERFAGWQEASSVTTIRFEDLVGNRGGGDDARKQVALGRVIQAVGLDLPQEQIEQLVHGSAATVTPTLRKGIIGDWRDSFDGSTLKMCDTHLGKHLQRMGYR